MEAVQVQLYSSVVESQVLFAVSPPQRVGQDCCWARHQVLRSEASTVLGSETVVSAAAAEEVVLLWATAKPAKAETAKKAEKRIFTADESRGDDGSGAERICSSSG